MLRCSIITTCHVPRETSKARLFPDAETAEYFAQQVIREVLPCDGFHSLLGLPQILRKQIMLAPVPIGVFQMGVCLPQSLHVALTCHEQSFPMRLPANYL